MDTIEEKNVIIASKNDFIDLINEINSKKLENFNSIVYNIQWKNKKEYNHRELLQSNFKRGGLFINRPVVLMSDTYWCPSTLQTDIIPIELVKKIEKSKINHYYLDITYHFITEKYKKEVVNYEWVYSTQYIERVCTESANSLGLEYRPNVGKFIKLNGYEQYPFKHEKPRVSDARKRVRKLKNIVYEKVGMESDISYLSFWLYHHANEENLEDFFKKFDGLTYQEIIDNLRNVPKIFKWCPSLYELDNRYS